MKLVSQPILKVIHSLGLNGLGDIDSDIAAKRMEIQLYTLAYNSNRVGPRNLQNDSTYITLQKQLAALLAIKNAPKPAPAPPPSAFVSLAPTPVPAPAPIQAPVTPTPSPAPVIQQVPVPQVTQTQLAPPSGILDTIAQTSNNGAAINTVPPSGSDYMNMFEAAKASDKPASASTVSTMTSETTSFFSGSSSGIIIALGLGALILLGKKKGK